MDLLTAFLEAVKADGRIGPTHISLYVALLVESAKNNFRCPLLVTSGRMMPVAKIHSRHTYNRCMKELKEYGYIRYQPSFNPLLESEVYLIKLREKV